MSSLLVARRLPVGAEILAGGPVHFRVWAPRRKRVEVTIENGPAIELEREADGYFSGRVDEAGEGSLYRFRLDGAALVPDPASRFQPEGPHGPSEVIDPGKFRWTDGAWRGAPLEGQVLYEMHIGTFTREGTYAAAMRELSELASLGITTVELMPVAEFPGRFNWGYDGVSLFAPTRNYGPPDDLRRFVDAAHAVGIGVILDVVYNHVGPDGNYLKEYAEEYFTGRYEVEWGEAINFDGERSGPVRDFYLANAGYWVEEFHMDGLRLDATQSIHDGSREHIVAALGRRVREAARGRATLLAAENEPQQMKLVRPVAEGGYGLDALWNDDFHHSAMAAMTGRNEAYYTDYRGAPQEFVSVAKHGSLYQGQMYKWQGKRRGTPTKGVNPAAFITFIQNHDQIANSGRGDRVHQLTSPGRYRAMTALLLLGPGTPMLFQGQEFAASSPFCYFADHKPDLAPAVRQGRIDFLSQFPSLARPEVQASFFDPEDPKTFEAAKLDFRERERNGKIYSMHRDLLRLRREDPVFRAQRPGGVDGAVLGPETFVLRFFGEGGDDRLLVTNLGLDLHLDPAPEPLLAPPEGMRWEQLWSSEDPAYGGLGNPPLDTVENWRIPGHATVVLRPRAPRTEEIEEERKRERAVAERKKRGLRSGGE